MSEVGISEEEMVIRERVARRIRTDPRANELLDAYEREQRLEAKRLAETIRPLKAAISDAEYDSWRRLRELEVATDRAVKERWDEIEAEIRAQGVTPPKTG